eukprot:2918439-Rhodomonas_salina.1
MEAALTCMGFAQHGATVLNHTEVPTPPASCYATCGTGGSYLHPLAMRCFGWLCDSWMLTKSLLCVLCGSAPAHCPCDV